MKPPRFKMVCLGVTGCNNDTIYVLVTDRVLIVRESELKYNVLKKKYIYDAINFVQVCKNIIFSTQSISFIYLSHCDVAAFLPNLILSLSSSLSLSLFFFLYACCCRRHRASRNSTPKDLSTFSPG
jgi:hypothetical protein